MNKLVIADRGARAIGKSAAVREVFYQLRREYEPKLEEWQYEKDEGDIKAIFEIDGVKVGIESQGDPGYDMEKTMDEFVEKYKCDIIVTACRPRGTTYHKVSIDLRNRRYDILWYAHYVYQGEGARNTWEIFKGTYAEQVVKLIKDRIAGKI